MESPAASPSTTPVDKTCRGSRFCSFNGPFHGAHLLALGARSQPTVVGRCYSPDCGAYVCNRCAHRRVPEHEGAELPAGATVLCCPFDGEPLGRDGEWLVLGAGGTVLERSVGFPQAIPPLAGMVEEQARELALRLGASFGLLERAAALLENGDPAAALAACRKAERLSPGSPLAALLTWRCQESRRAWSEAWAALRSLLRQHEAVIRATVDDVASLRELRQRSGEEAPEAERLTRHAVELQALVTRRRMRPPQRARRRSAPVPDLPPELAALLDSLLQQDDETPDGGTTDLGAWEQWNARARMLPPGRAAAPPETAGPRETDEAALADLFRDLFQSEPPAFEKLGARALEDGEARRLAELAKASPELLERLRAWLAVPRVRRSFFRGADVPTVLRNLALIHLRATRQARGLDLRELDLSGLALAGCDFSGADLTGANLRHADLREAVLYDAVLVGATLAGTDLTGARLAGAVTAYSDFEAPAAET